MPSTTTAGTAPKGTRISRVSGGTVFFWLRQGDADARAAHVGFIAKSESEVNAFYEAAMAAGAIDNGKPGARLYYDPRYYALIIYGATGYTGQLVSEQAKRAGLDFVVAGRDAAKVGALADELDVTPRVFSVEDAEGMRSALYGCTAILNCAGPFARTARPIMEACLDASVHYLDITAEFNVYALAESLSPAATVSPCQATAKTPESSWSTDRTSPLSRSQNLGIPEPQRIVPTARDDAGAVGASREPSSTKGRRMILAGLSRSMGGNLTPWAIFTAIWSIALGATSRSADKWPPGLLSDLKPILSSGLAAPAKSG